MTWLLTLPTSATIERAEARLLQSRRKLLESVVRIRSAVRAAVARPSTLLLVAVASGISAFFVARRLRPSRKSVASSARSTVSSPSLVGMLVSMYGAQVLAFVLQLGAVAWKQGGTRVKATMPSPSAPDNTATTEHAP